MSEVTHTARISLLRVGALFGLALSGIVAAFATIAPGPEADLPPGVKIIRETVAFPVADAVLPVPSTYFAVETFRRGETFADLLARLGLRVDDAKRVIASGALRKLRTGSEVTAQLDANGGFESLHYVVQRRALVRASAGTQGIEVTERDAPFDTFLVFKSGEIRSSLFAAADVSDIPDSVAIQMADIFGGDIDFHRDLRKGDTFSVVYEVNYLDGHPVGTGRVIATEFVNKGKSIRAVHYAGADGKGGYYAPDGSNLRKAFLRSPLDFSRVSSGFGMRRHPFLQTWRAHNGVDYAAPIGTRVRAVGDGVVEFAGTQNGYGNLVILRHHGSTSTRYAHLNGFAKGLHRGARVSQGDTIGYVGKTGWATGPHLHYEFHIGKEARNPLAVVLPAALPVPANERKAFLQHAEPLVAQLDFLASTALARAD